MKKSSSQNWRVYKVMLNPDVKAADFEKFMETQVLENTITFRDGHSSQDELYSKKSGGKNPNSYIWIINRTPSINGTFTGNNAPATAFKSLKTKVEQFGFITPL